MSAVRSGDEIFEFDSENDEIETEYDANYPADEDEDENALWDDGEDTADDAFLHFPETRHEMDKTLFVTEVVYYPYHSDKL